MNPPESFNITTSVHFRSKLLFSASQNLTSSRSCRLFPTHPPVNHPDLWKIKAPDFTPKLYRSTSLPQIKRKTFHLVKQKGSLDEKSLILEKINTVAPLILPRLEKKRDGTRPFIACYKPDSVESKQLFVRTGMYPLGLYKDPKPYNFRPCVEGMRDMVTSLEKDPGGLIFNSQYLRTVTGSQSDLNAPHRDKVSKMDTFRPPELKWDPRLILPKTPWPPKSASYTRHRRRRGVYSALMDRVEEKLNNTLRK